MKKAFTFLAIIVLASGQEYECQSPCSEDCSQFCDTDLYSTCCLLELEEFLSNNDISINEAPIHEPESEFMESRLHSNHKKSSAFNDVLRLGKRVPTSDVLRLGKRDEFLRLGRTPTNDVLRLGKRTIPDIIRLGRSPSIDNILRLGKRSSSSLDNFLRLGKRDPEKRSNDMLRLGKRPALVDDAIRLGKRYGNEDMLRLGKRSLSVPAWLGKRTRLSITPAFNDVLRLGKRSSDDMLRLGKRDE